MKLTSEKISTKIFYLIKIDICIRNNKYKEANEQETTEGEKQTKNVIAINQVRAE